MNITFISAGAGTGKTHRVTEEICKRMVKDGLQPAGLIATSFTKKAARELADRIRRKLHDAEKSALAERLDEARIGTVHGVCQRLLARHAFEAGISPRLEVLDEATANVLLSEASEAVLPRADLQAIQRLGERLSQWELRNGRPTGKLTWKQRVKELVDLSRSNGFTPTELAAMAERSCDTLLAHFGPETRDDLDTLLKQAMQQALAAIAGNEGGKDNSTKYTDELRKQIKNLEHSQIDWPTWMRLAKAEPAKAFKGDSEIVRQVAGRYAEHPQLRRDIRDYTRRLYAAAAATLDTYQSFKEEQGMVDFTDLEQRTLELLDVPAVADALRQELELVVVDEFQDTSPMQLAIFLKLSALAKASLWVGDVKQAIYGFRGTDPELIAAVARKLGVGERLAKSRRSVPDLVRVNNALFSPAFEQSLGLKTAEVELAAHRRAPTHAQPAVEFLEVSSGQVVKTHGRLAALVNDDMALAVAEGVRQLLTSTPPKLVAQRSADDAPERFEPLRPRDVAVLCRSNGQARLVANWLTAAGFAVSFSRAGLLATPEATLALACLRRLADPEDQLATAEVIALQGGTKPEDWLNRRLEYLAGLRADKGRPDRWGLEPPLVVPVITALHEAHGRHELASPSEALDLALERGEVFSVVTGWGPDALRGEQRRANLEALRALVMQFEEHARTAHVPATIAGFLHWCDALAAQGADFQASDPEADSIQVLTYHSAKGLEWPVTVCADLDTELRSRLWQPSVVKDDPESAVDLDRPLDGRWLRLWVSPFGAHTKDVALRTKLEDCAEGKASRNAAIAEELRLLYVGFTRARDTLVPVVEKERPQEWLDILGAAWFQPGSTGLTLPDHTRLAASTRMVIPPSVMQREEAPTTLRWLPEASRGPVRLPARITPSKQPPVNGVAVGEVVELGSRLATNGSWDEAALGNVMHSLLAAEFLHPAEADRIGRVQQLLTAHGLGATVTAADVLAAADRFRTAVTTRFQPIRIVVEVPFSFTNDHGQQMSGFMDLLLETPSGWVVIDHKTYPGKRSNWNREALSYSGQLTTYAEALTRSGRRVAGTWVHFFVGGGLVKVES